MIAPSQQRSRLGTTHLWGPFISSLGEGHPLEFVSCSPCIVLHPSPLFRPTRAFLEFLSADGGSLASLPGLPLGPLCGRMDSAWPAFPCAQGLWSCCGGAVGAVCVQASAAAASVWTGWAVRQADLDRAFWAA